MKDECNTELPIEINPLLSVMVTEEASDLFITVGVPPTLKVDGKTKPLSKSVLLERQVVALVESVMNKRQATEFDRTMEANFALYESGIGRFRVNVFQQQNYIGMVIRRIKTEIPTLDAVGASPLLKDLAMAKRGLIIFVGATGSGKSTTLAAMVGHCNQHRHGHIVTVEDPVEFIHQHRGCIITQREVGIDTISFENALKNTLRQAPDIIMIGEIRSRETMEHAIAFSETGHLVFSTLHANNASQALDRIINFFPEDRRQQLLMDLSFNLKAVVAQRLIPLTNGHGRCVAAEILLNTPLVSDLILKGDIHLLRDLMKSSKQAGMQIFDQALFELYKRGEISADDAILFADSPNEVRLMIKLGSGIDPRNLAAAIEGMSIEGSREAGQSWGGS